MERASQAAEEASVCGRGCPQAILERRHLNDGRARVSRVRRNGEMTRGGDRPGAPENALRTAGGAAAAKRIGPAEAACETYILAFRALGQEKWRKLASDGLT